VVAHLKDLFLTRLPLLVSALVMTRKFISSVLLSYNHKLEVNEGIFIVEELDNILISLRC
jgi:hypothetical protein